MKQLLFLLAFFLFAFEDKTATLKFTKEQYNAVQANLIDVIKTIDSIKVILHYNSDNSKADASAARAQQELIQVSNFIAQIDSVFNKK